MTPATHRLDLNVHPELKRRVAELAESEDKSFNDVVSEILCQHFGLDHIHYQVPRRPPGRKSRIVAKREQRR